MFIEKGKIVAFTTGAYSDYCLRGHMRALVDFNADALVHEFKMTDEFASLTELGRASTLREVFMAWLVKTGVFEPLVDEVTEWCFEVYDDLLSINQGNDAPLLPNP